MSGRIRDLPGLRGSGGTVLADRFFALSWSVAGCATALDDVGGVASTGFAASVPGAEPVVPGAAPAAGSVLPAAVGAGSAVPGALGGADSTTWAGSRSPGVGADAAVAGSAGAAARAPFAVVAGAAADSPGGSPAARPAGAGAVGSAARAPGSELPSSALTTRTTAISPAIPTPATAAIGSHDRRGERIIIVGRTFDVWLGIRAGSPASCSVCAC